MDDPRPTRRLPVVTLAVVAVLATTASVALRRTATPGAGGAPAPPPHGAAGAPDGVRAPERALPPARPTDAPPPPRRLETHARLAVDRYVDEVGLHEAIGDAQREALVVALGRLRASSRWLTRHPRARGAAESRRREALIEADRVFRDTLGVGVGEFIAALAPPGTIEDLGAARQ